MTLGLPLRLAARGGEGDTDADRVPDTQELLLPLGCREGVAAAVAVGLRVPECVELCVALPVGERAAVPEAAQVRVAA